MNSNLEEIYNQSLEMLSQGKTEQEILAHFKDAQKELAPLLQISALLNNIPVNPVPTPFMQRKYEALTKKSLWLGFVHISRFAAVSVGLSLLTAGLVATGFAADQSAPGEALFAVKKTTEKIQLVLAQNQNARASLEIKIAQKRLQEAQAVLNNPSSDPELKTAVINELASQTKTAVEKVNTITTTNPTLDNNEPLLSSLDSITKEQQGLLKQIEQNSEVKILATKALESLSESSAQISEIKSKVAVADSEQTLAALNANQNSTVIVGEITKIDSKKITVEKTEFLLTKNTYIQNSEGQKLELTDLTKGQRVSVTGVKDDLNNITASFVVINQSNNGAVESASTTKPSTIEPTPTPALEKVEETDPNITTGGFILEDPNPQFAQ